MFPKAYKIINGTEYFMYDKKELAIWREYGYKDGSTGMLLFSRNPAEGIVKYKGFGTLENPCKQMLTLSMKHFPLFDGEWLAPHKIVKSFEQEKRSIEEFWKRYGVDHKFIILDFAGDGENNYQKIDPKFRHYPLLPEDCFKIKTDTT